MKPFHLQKLGLSHWWSLSPRPCSPSKTSACVRRPSRRQSPLVLLLVSVATLTGVIGHRFYNEPRLSVGKPAPETIRAPRAASVEDKEATEAARQAARPNVLSVFMVSPDLTQRIRANFEIHLTEITQMRQAAGALPFLRPTQISTPVQRYLRQLNADQLEGLLTQEINSAQPVSLTAAAASTMAQQAQVELFNYREQGQDNGAWSQLLEEIQQAQERYQAALRSGSAQLTALDTSKLLGPTDADWPEVQTSLKRILERILAQGISPGLPPVVLRDAVKVHLRELTPEAQALGLQLLPMVLRPNLVIDPAGTQAKLAQEVPPVMVTVRQGEVIVKAGAPITQANFVLLDHFELSRRGINWLGLLGTTVLVSGGIGLFLVARIRTQTHLSGRDYLLILLLATSAPLIAWMTVPSYTSLPAVGLLVGSFYGSVLGATVIVLLTALMPLGLSSSALLGLVAIAAGSLVGSIVVRQPRSREELALVGLIVALTPGHYLFPVADGHGRCSA